MNYRIWSHPSWVRGLKLTQLEKAKVPYAKSHPSWVRGLKHNSSTTLHKSSTSHPSWVRGLKQNDAVTHFACGGSHPSWVRGLKQKTSIFIFGPQIVAPLVGAWIETNQI